MMDSAVTWRYNVKSMLIGLFSGATLCEYRGALHRTTGYLEWWNLPQTTELELEQHIDIKIGKWRSMCKTYIKFLLFDIGL